MAVVARPHAQSRITLSDRDQRIVELASHRLRGAPVDFGEAMRALRDAVEEVIPAGRVFLIGTTEAGPIIGSNISGIGITERASGVYLVRVERFGGCMQLGRFAP